VLAIEAAVESTVKDAWDDTFARRTRMPAMETGYVHQTRRPHEGTNAHATECAVEIDVKTAWEDPVLQNHQLRTTFVTPTLTSAMERANVSRDRTVVTCAHASDCVQERIVKTA